MAAESVLLGGYKVGSISASLCVDNSKEGRKRTKDSSSIFSNSDSTQPTFVPVRKKKKIKSEESLAEGNNADGTEKELDESKPYKKISKLPKSKSSDDDPERLARTIFVGNLPLSISRKELKVIFKKYGEVESTRLRSVAVPDLKTSKKVAAIKKTFNPHRNNINGYVVFKEKKSVEKALASNGKQIDKLHIRVDRVDSSAKQYDHKKSVFVGNLTFDIEEERLGEFFAPCGEVLNVRVIRDATTGIGKGFGYVLFKDSSSVTLALKMNNSEVCGRKIRIQRSQEYPKGTSKSGERKQNDFSGMQAKEKFYHKRKMLKQQQKFGLSISKKIHSKVTERNKKTHSKGHKQSSGATTKRTTLFKQKRKRK